MADKNNLPQASLLFSGSDSFSFPQLNTSATLVPVVGQEATMIPSEEEGEADSFLGQNNPPTSQPAPFTFFQQQSNGSDPFSQIGSDAPDPFAQISDQRQPPLIQEQQPELFAASSQPSQPTPPPPASQPYSPQQFYQPPPPSHTPQSQSFSSPPQSFHTPPPSFSTPSMTSAPPQDNVFRPTPQSPQYGESLPMGVPPPPTDSQLQSQWQQQGGSMSASSTGSSLVGTPGYEPVQPHWFYCKIVEGREVWLPFSLLDSLRLEEAFSTAVQQDPENYVIPTNGGRYDVHLNDRLRYSVFWDEDPSIVRRCTWFYKGDGDNKFVPYAEDFSERLESEYFNAVTNNAWHRRLEFPGGETIVMHNPNVIVHFRQTPDEWGTTPDGQMRPRVVKRGVDDVVEIEDGSSEQIKKWRNLITDEGEVGPADHLVFVVHGIGPVCDLRFRSPVECVDDFRAVSQMLTHTHFKHGVDEGKVHRVEFLPVHWHKALHGDATGVDRQLKKITLPSIGRLRHFTNDTLLDILFYTSPSYCQTIAETVASEMDRLWDLFLSRNPRFVGGVSVVGHSLGSLIVFDLLAHQGMSAGTPSTEQQTPAGPPPEPEPQEETPDEQQEETTQEQEEEELSLDDLFSKLGLDEYKETFQQEKIDMESLVLCSEADLKEMGVPMGPRKKLFGFLKEQKTAKERKKAEAEDRKRREAERVAQEAARKAAEEERQRQQQQTAVGNGSITSLHVDYDTGHSGIGMPHIRYPPLKFSLTNFFALGSPIGMFLVTRGIEEIGEDFTLPTCPNFFNIFHPFDPVAYRIEPIVNPTVDVKPVLIPHHKGRKRLHLELKESLSRMGTDLKRAIIGAAKKGWTSIHDFARAHSANEDVQADLDSMADNIVQEIKEEEERMQVSAAVENPPPEDVQIGKLNRGNRIDYVLQEKPIESFNEYLFALGSHVCYWESEDTVLLLMKEIYSTSGVLPMIPGSQDR
ncbi:triacylglycerol hydrolase DDHD2-like isoform X1 [Branchiostoma floridae x Branchiostoma japonicum]